MGCRVCRARKVKCDGKPNGCRNCERLQLDCVGENGITTVAALKTNDAAATTTSSSPSVVSPASPTASSTMTANSAASTATSISLRKIRTYRSCTSCRLSKTKCNGDRPRCARCVAKQLDCVYDGGSAPRWTRSLHGGPVGVGPGSERADEMSVSSKGGLKARRVSASARGPSGEEGDTPPGNSPPVEALPRGGDKDTAARPLTAIGSAASASMPNIASVVPGSGAGAVPALPVDPFISDTTSWLLSPSLPSPRHLRRVVEHYFANIHPIRCFAFVHKPSFMRQLDNGFNSDDESALLHIICAHGAKFHALTLAQNDPSAHGSLQRVAGNQWAKKAESILLGNYGKISVQRLMTAILLYDFRFRLGEYGQALMLSGLAVRMAQALKLNHEYSSDILCAEGDGLALSVVSRESRRRLMWACYVLDVWTGHGVDHLTLLRESDIKIQLPCNERNFGLRIASVTETLGVGHVLQFLSPAVVPPKPAANMGIMAYYIRIVTLWKRVLRYIKSAESGPAPWKPESDFAALDADMGKWRRELPDFVEYSLDTIYARLDSNQLGGLVLIHSTYHHNYLELYKISMPDLYRLGRAPTFPAEHAELLQALQADSYFHALQIARVLSEVAEHGARLLSDSLLPFFVLDSSRVMLYYAAWLLNPKRVDAQERVREAISAVESNNTLLRMMIPLYPIAESLSVTVDRWLYKMRQGAAAFLASGNRQDANNMDDVELASSIASSSINGTGASDYASLPPPVTIARTPTIHSAPPSERHPLPQHTAAGGPSRSTSWMAVNSPSESPRAENWDQTSAAQQLVGLKQDSSASTISRQQQRRQHSSQSQSPPHRQQHQQHRKHQPICEALDLEDLQNFVSWDIHGIIDISDTVSASNHDDEAKMSSWGSMV